jgi:cobalt-zinc-cadmium efflux system protein
MASPSQDHAHDHDDHGHEGHDHARHDHDGHTHGAAEKTQAKHAHHGHAHGHGHHHDHRGSSESKLRIALIITALFTLVELIGGFIAGSLALVADSVHMLTDGASLLLALIALRVARRPADARFSYGHGRYEVLAAFVNGLALLVLSGWIIVEAVQRLIHPETVQAKLMLIVAGLGFAANLVTFLVLRDSEDSLNMRGAVLHVLSDLLGSAAAMVAAVMIMVSGVQALDPALSAVVAALILKGGWRVTRESAHILLEGTPQDVDAADLASDLATSVPGITGIHHLHAWSLTDRRPVMTMHAVLAAGADRDHALDAIQARLRQRFGEVHATVQIEQAACASDGCEDETAHVGGAHAHQH